MNLITQVIVCDDHPLLREGLKSIVADCRDIEITREVSDGSALLEAIRTENYNLILLDLMLPGRSGFEILKLVKHEYPKLPVIVLSSHKEDMFAMRTIRAGASGYICKHNAAETLIEAIRKVASGGCYISSYVADLLAKEINTPDQSEAPQNTLSDREYQVFLMIAAGKGSSQIADELNVSIKTISTHRTRIKSKTGLSNTSEIVRYAVEHNLVEEIPE